MRDPRYFVRPSGWRLALGYTLGFGWILLCLPITIPMIAYQTWRDRRRYARRTD